MKKRIRKFVEYTSEGKKIHIKRGYYPDDDVWICLDCYHVGTDFILASISCENCANGVTQSFLKKDEKYKP